MSVPIHIGSAFKSAKALEPWSSHHFFLRRHSVQKDSRLSVEHSMHARNNSIKDLHSMYPLIREHHAQTHSILELMGPDTNANATRPSKSMKQDSFQINYLWRAPLLQLTLWQVGRLHGVRREVEILFLVL